MKSVKYIIIEDEYPAQQVLLKHAEKLPNMECIGVFSDVLNAELTDKLALCDLLFLDINLPSMDGLSFLKIKKPDTAIILTTAYSEYSLESYNYNVVDYLLKPIRFERFFQAIEKFNKQTKYIKQNNATDNKKTDVFFIKSDKEVLPIKLENIEFIESLKDYVIIHLDNKKITHNKNLRYWEQTLTDAHFIRIHQSYIINTQKIKKIHANAVEVKGTILTIGRKYKDRFEAYKKAINIH